jgi:hypothetical protein
LVRALPGVAVAALFFLLDRPVAAVVVLEVVAGLTVVSMASPAADRAIDRAIAWVGHRLGRLISIVVLGAVAVFVLFPVSVLSHLLGRDPIAAETPGSGRWAAHPGAARRLTGRSYARDPSLVAGGEAGVYRRRSRLRTAVRVVVVLLVLDLVIGAVFNRLTRPETEYPTGNADVFAGQEYTTVLFEELSSFALLDTYHPYLEWDQEDFDGQVVNVEDGLRASYEPVLPAGAEPFDIWFFGGSTLFGFSQRDEHTIPSEVARLAEQDGVPVRVRNYGTFGYVGWQEVLKLQEILTREDSRPDLVVFYDGWNDLDMQVQDPEVGAAINHRYRQLFADRLQGSTASDSGLDEWGTIWRAYHLRSLTAQLARRTDRWLDPPGEPEEYDESRYPTDERARDVVARYERGMELATQTGQAWGFDVSFVWQPYLESSPDQHPQPELVEGIPGYVEDTRDVWLHLTEDMQGRLPPEVIDLTAALDDEDRPLFHDQVHMLEPGAAAVARALYAELAPQLPDG